MSWNQLIAAQYRRSCLDNTAAISSWCEALLQLPATLPQMGQSHREFFCDGEQFCMCVWWLLETLHVNTCIGLTHTCKNWWYLNNIYRLYQCQFLGFDIVLNLCKMLPLGEAGWRSIDGTSWYYFCNFLWIYNYFKLKELKNGSGSECGYFPTCSIVDIWVGG